MAKTDDPCADMVFYRTCCFLRQLGAGRLDEFGGTSVGLYRQRLLLLLIWTWTISIKCNTTSTYGNKSDKGKGEKAMR